MEDDNESIHHGQRWTGGSSRQLREDSQSAAILDPWGLHQCAACQEKYLARDMVHTPCGHAYCEACIAQLFTVSIDDDGRFPARCCGLQIPLDMVRYILDPALLEQYGGKMVEFSTADRTYCAQPACSAFIPPSQIMDNVGTCPLCKQHTCANCSDLWHEGTCIHDSTLQSILDTAREHRWVRCCSCKRIVEKIGGCNHMVCYCGVAFCYDCGGPWMMCSCRNGPDPLEDIPAGFLLNLDRNVVGLPEGMRQRAERVGQAAQERRRRGRDSVTRLYELLRQDRLDQHLWNPEVHRPSQGAFRPTSRRGQQPERSGRLVTLRSLRRAAGTPQNHLNLRLNTVWNPVARDVGRDYVEVANAELIRRFTERGNEGRDNQGVDEP